MSVGRVETVLFFAQARDRLVGTGRSFVVVSGPMVTALRIDDTGLLQGHALADAAAAPCAARPVTSGWQAAGRRGPTLGRERR